MTGGSRTVAPAHRFVRDALGQLTVEAGPAGLLLGVDADRRPVRLRLLRPEPTRLTFVGGAWAARLLLFRLLALGARIAVRATEPQHWTALDALVGGVGRVWPVAPDPRQPEHAFDLPADDTSPLVHLGPGGVPARASLGPWQTQAILLGQITATATVALAESDVVLVQRIAEPDAVLAAATLGLSTAIAAGLRAAADDVVTVVSRGDAWPVWLHPTSVERHFFGPPSR